MSGVKLVYRVISPVNVQYAPTAIRAIEGTNYVWSTGNTISVSYPVDTKSYIDSSSGNVDLTNYVRKTDYATSSAAGVVLLSNTSAITADNNHRLQLTPASSVNIQMGVNNTYPITSGREHEAVFYGLAKAAGDDSQSESENAVGTYTEDAKAAIREMLDIPSGTILSNLVARVDALEYEPLTLNIFSASPNLAEIGSTVSNVTLNYSMNKDATTMKLDDADVPNTTATGSISLTGLSLSANKTWNLKAQDAKMEEQSEWVSKNTTLTFTNKIKYGVAAIPGAINDSFLNGLANKVLFTSKLKTITVNAGSGEYIWYALPSSYGTCTFTVGGFTGGFALVSTFNHTNESGATVEYRVYRSDNANLGSTTVTVA